MKNIFLIKLTYNGKVSMSHEPNSTRELCANAFHTVAGDFCACLVDGTIVCVDASYIKLIHVDVVN